MGSTTKKGLPYPIGTDRVMDGDNAIQALAEAVDVGKGIVFGTVNCVATNSASGQGVITFPVGAFTAPPVVVAMPNGIVSGSQSVWYANATAVTATGCNINILHRDGTSATATLVVAYMAVGP